MLKSLKAIYNYKVHARDGDVGKVYGFFFDDSTWEIRYAVVETGLLLLRRRVLIAPVVLKRPNWQKRTLPLDLTRDQIMNSPDIDTDKPVSRVHQIELHDFYGWPSYWAAGFGPILMMPSLAMPEDEQRKLTDLKTKADPHLRNSKAVAGYQVEALRDHLGKLVDFIADEKWTIRYLVTDAEILLPTSTVKGISWTERKVLVDIRA